LVDGRSLEEGKTFKDDGSSTGSSSSNKEEHSTNDMSVGPPSVASEMEQGGRDEMDNRAIDDDGAVTLSKKVATLKIEPTERDESERDSMDDGSIIYPSKVGAEKVESTAVAGHAMELPRMLPGRHASFCLNLPYALAFSFLMWLSFHVMFEPYTWHDDLKGYRDMADMGLLLLVVVVMMFAIAAVYEIVVLSTPPNTVTPKLEFDDVVEDEAVTAAKVVSVSTASLVTVKIGRPVAQEMLNNASSATCPGIFVCGPAGLTAAVWKEVRKENSFLLRTRYCVYEEVFEL
jgi:hypothetical protein